MRACLLRLVLLLLLPLLGAPPLAAQPMSGGSETATQQRPGLFTDLMDAIASGSRLLIDRIQPGRDRDLVDNPRYESQRSPRQSLMTLIAAMELVDRGYDEVGYPRALASLPPEAGRDDADTLYQILLRLGPVSAAELPGAEQIAASGDTRYEYFPRGTDHLWVWQAAAPPTDAAIALERGADGAWRLTPATIAAAPGLLEAIAALPPRYGDGDGGQYFLQVFAPLVERTGLWGWASFAITTAIGVIGGILVAGVLGALAGRSRRAGRIFLASSLRGLGNAGGLVFFAVVFTSAIGFLELGSVLRPLRYEIPRFLLIVAVALLAVSAIDVAAAFARSRIDAQSGPYDRMVVTLVRRVLRVFVITLVLLFVVENMLGFNVGALLVGFGFIALALSLAAQDTVKNLFGAITVFINRPFVIGDWIVFQGELDRHVGVVQDIQLQSTKLQDLGGNLVTLPNMLFIDREVENLSARGHIRREVNLAIPYRTDAAEIDRAIEALRDVFNDPEVLADARAEGRDDTPHVGFAAFEESWLTIRGFHYYFMGDEGEVQRTSERGWFSYLSHCSMVNRKIVEVFGTRGIEFAFPTRTHEIVPRAGDPVTVRRTE